jgi:sulfite reductase alpha subunit-like flavoprotein
MVCGARSSAAGVGEALTEVLGEALTEALSEALSAAPDWRLRARVKAEVLA